MNEKILELLYRSFDDKLTSEEQRQLDEALAASKELREQKEELAGMRKAIVATADASFKPFFSTRVMQRIKFETLQDEDFARSLAWAFRRIALVGAIAILALVVNNLLVEDHGALDSALAMPQLSLEDSWQLDIVLGEEEL